MKGENYRTQSYVAEAASNNSIFSIWTKTWGLHIYPWYSADKLKFSFVEVGKNGKGFDIYMDTIKFGAPCFYKWAKDILNPNRKFESILNNEKQAGEKYPKAYKFITGNNGNKSIGICNSQNGKYCINGTVKDENGQKYANIPIEFSDLEMLADFFLHSYSKRMVQLETIRERAEVERSQYFKDTDGGI